MSPTEARSSWSIQIAFEAFSLANREDSVASIVELNESTADRKGAICSESLHFGRKSLSETEASAGFDALLRFTNQTDDTGDYAQRTRSTGESKVEEDEMKKLIIASLVAMAMALGATVAAMAGNEESCAPRTLHGRYVFTARGFTIVGGVAQPKAIVEVIDFDGDGGVSVPKATVSLNGMIRRLMPGADGMYTIDDACTGTIQFSDALGTAFDIVASPRANEIWMIQTNPNSVFQGTATRTLRAHDQEEQ